MRHESPCKSCTDHPCKEPKDCERRWKYISSFKDKDHMKAVNLDDSYRLVPM
jgi:hypothetical protein